jgi:hypothetical protein
VALTLVEAPKGERFLRPAARSPVKEAVEQHHQSSVIAISPMASPAHNNPELQNNSRRKDPNTLVGPSGQGTESLPTFVFPGNNSPEAEILKLDNQESTPQQNRLSLLDNTLPLSRVRVLPAPYFPPLHPAIYKLPGEKLLSPAVVSHSLTRHQD